MNELIKITEHNGKRVVSARVLHKALDIKDHFSQWIQRMLDYGFIQGVDYEAVHGFVQASNGIGGTNKTDYALDMDCCKEISMIQRTDKGKEARLYFIACEKKSQHVLPGTYLEALQALTINVEQTLLLEQENKAQAIALNAEIETNKENKPKVVFAESVQGSQNSILVRQFAKDISDDTFKIGEKKLYKWFRVNNYVNAKNEPYQQYVNQGIFEVKTRTVGDAKYMMTAKTTMVTGKGQVYFVGKLK